MREASAEKDSQTHDDRSRNQHCRQTRRRCGTGRARRAGEGSRHESRHPEEEPAKAKKTASGAKPGAKAKAAHKRLTRAVRKATPE